MSDAISTLAPTVADPAQVAVPPRRAGALFEEALVADKLAHGTLGLSPLPRAGALSSSDRSLAS